MVHVKRYGQEVSGELSVDFTQALRLSKDKRQGIHIQCEAIQLLHEQSILFRLTAGSLLLPMLGGRSFFRAQTCLH